MKEETFGVALTKEACPLCGKTQAGDLIINTRLSVSMANRVKELHGKTIGYMKHPCDECKSLMAQGVLLIGFVEEKSEKGNPYRSGNQWVVTADFIKRVFDEPFCTQFLERGAGFIDVKTASAIGFPNVNLNA